MCNTAIGHQAIQENTAGSDSTAIATAKPTAGPACRTQLSDARAAG